MPRLSKIGASALAAFGWTSSTANGGVTATYLVVAGGGGGNASGGGAGGFLTGTTTLTLTTSYTVIVGAGGAANGSSGSNSSVTGLTASVGGGAGATGVNNGSVGGSGGGGSQTGTGGAGTAGQGNNGGNGGGIGSAGGGGGAGAVGAIGTGGTTGGAGGVGLANSISGTSTFYAGGGGGGGGSTGGAGGNGGGGAGSVTTGTAGSTNTGGGGGGGFNTSGASGGSGIVIISYAGAQQFGGGTVTSSGGNTIHTFTTSGVLSTLASLSASYLIVAGGGGGGGAVVSSYNGGAGGAGGLLSGSGTVIDTASTYLVTVGAGGTAGSSSGSVTTNGSNSTFSIVSTSAVGGGGGGSGTPGTNNGATGGSGGGSQNGGSSAASGTAGQGNSGGIGFNSGVFGTGGGGGSGAVGSNATVSVGGAGGIGTTSSISGTSTYYSGGGGGAGQGGSASGAGGLGGGGAGGSNAAGTSGTANTGGGGGGSASNTSSFAGGSGGSGVVIISYPGSTQLMTGGTVTITGGNVIHTFTSSGYLERITFFSNSLRTRSSASARLQKTYATTRTSGTTATISLWVKRGTLATSSTLFYGYDGTSGFATELAFGSTGTIIASCGGPSGAATLTTSATYNDVTTWYNFVLAIDTTQATSTNRAKLYVNGVEVTSFSSATYPAQNATINWFLTNANNGICYNAFAASNYFDGYITNFNAIDGQALTPFSFGAFNSAGVWRPITYGGSYGTNGFLLPFTNKTSTTTLGNDFSPNGNNWTPTNVSLTAGTTYDSMTDVPTLTNTSTANYSTLSQTVKGSAITLSNGNLEATNSSNNTSQNCRAVATLGMSSKKWYCEVTMLTANGVLGVMLSTDTVNQYLGDTSLSWGYVAPTGTKITSTVQTGYGSSYGAGDVIGIAFDADARSLTFYKNNVSQGVAFSGLSAGTYYFAQGDFDATITYAFNFGQQGFKYTPPSGYLALNAFNL